MGKSMIDTSWLIVLELAILLALLHFDTNAALVGVEIGGPVARKKVHLYAAVPISLLGIERADRCLGLWQASPGCQT